MGRAIIWSDEAANDFDEILTYLDRDSHRYAISLREEIYESVEYLTEFPEIGRRVPEVDDSRLREIFVGQYRILYYYEGSDISILSIVHMSRDLVKYWQEHQ